VLDVVCKVGVDAFAKEIRGTPLLKAPEKFVQLKREIL
jgi:hypothetical protein